MSYWVLTVSGNVISCISVKLFTNLERNTDEWSQQMREYNILIEQRLDVNDADLLKGLVIVYRWNKMTVADEDPEFLNESNRVISDGSIPKDEENNETGNKEKDDGYNNLELVLTRRDDDGLMYSIVKKRNMDDEDRAVGIMNNNPLLDTREYKV